SGSRGAWDLAGISRTGCCDQFGHRFDLHIALLQLPLVVLLEQHRTDQPDNRGLVGEDPDDIGAALEERKLEYILGARERIIRPFVLEDEAPLTPLLVNRTRGETQLFVKEVKLGAVRYILCRNEAEAERERNERQAIVAGVAKQLAGGDKAL